MKYDDDMIDIFLQPGEYFVGNEQYRIRTLLGSCVSITLWHPHLRIGAMSHFLLSSREATSVSELDGRYGVEALSLMCQELRQVGVCKEECQGKIFGGGNMFPNQMRSDGLNVGQKNGETARALLQQHGIKILSESLFGNGHRQIAFNVASGDVWVKQIKPVDLGAKELRWCA
ncbi:MAG: chemotaxis protein CheD [Burkholderiaceae bacterium]